MTTQAPPRTRHIGVGHFQTTPLMRQLVNEVLDSGRISYGPMSLAFERRFAELHGAQYAILSNSGTSSLQVALQALKEIRHWNNGDRVICPAQTFIASANVIIHNRMTPTFVDVDERTSNINPQLIEDAITPNTRAIMAVHLFGQPADMTAINEIAKRRGLAVIEDACEAMMARHNGQMIGTLGDVAVFSLYVSHILVTGVGGIATTNDPEIAGKIRSLQNHGLTLECLDAGENFSPRPVPNRLFKFESVGSSMRLTEFEAALGLAQIDDLDANIGARRRNGKHLTAGITNINNHYRDVFQAPYTLPGNEHDFMMYNLVMKQGDRDSLIAWLAQNGIETRDSVPLLSQPAFWYLNKEDYPVAARMLTSAFYLPCHNGLGPEDIGFIIGCIGEWVDPMFPNIYRER